jgi:hypothetical protein
MDLLSQTTCSKATYDHQRSPVPSTPSSISSRFMSTSHSFKCLAFIPVAPDTRPLCSCPTTTLNSEFVGAASGTLEGSALNCIAHPGGGGSDTQLDLLVCLFGQHLWAWFWGSVLRQAIPPLKVAPCLNVFPCC